MFMPRWFWTRAFSFTFTRALQCFDHICPEAGFIFGRSKHFNCCSDDAFSPHKHQEAAWHFPCHRSSRSMNASVSSVCRPDRNTFRSKPRHRMKDTWIYFEFWFEKKIYIFSFIYFFSLLYKAYTSLSLHLQLKPSHNTHVVTYVSFPPVIHCYETKNKTESDHQSDSVLFSVTISNNL